MERYIGHHLKIAGSKNSPFDDQALTAIHQGSGRLFRKANHLARGALLAAASEKSQQEVLYCFLAIGALFYFIMMKNGSDCCGDTKSTTLTAIQSWRQGTFRRPP